MIPSFEQLPVSAESAPERTLEQKMLDIKHILGAITKLCAENPLAKTLFESADNWSMPFEKHVELLQRYLDDESFDPSRKNTLVSGMLPLAEALLEALETQTARDRNAETRSIKEAKEKLSQFHIETIGT